MTDHIAVPLDLATQILNYLGTRPYVEVAGMIDPLQSCSPIKITHPEEDDVDD